MHELTLEAVGTVGPGPEVTCLPYSRHPVWASVQQRLRSAELLVWLSASPVSTSCLLEAAADEPVRLVHKVKLLRLSLSPPFTVSSQVWKTGNPPATVHKGPERPHSTCCSAALA